MSIDTGLAIGGIVLGLVALAVAVPPFVQMIWGAPNLRIESYDNVLDGGIKQLRCNILNQGISSRILRKLRVYRLPTEISASFSITESGTRKTIINLRRPEIRTDREKSELVSLGASITPARFNMVIHGPGASAFIPADGNNSDHPLSMGRYIAHLSIVSSGQDLHEAKWEFVVGETPIGTYWNP